MLFMSVSVRQFVWSGVITSDYLGIDLTPKSHSPEKAWLEGGVLVLAAYWNLLHLAIHASREGRRHFGQPVSPADAVIKGS